MIFDQFIEKYKGKAVDFDGSYGDQCVDLVRQYIKEVLEQPQPKGVVGAKDFWTNFESDPNLKNYFLKIPDTKEAIPQKGDIVIWGSNYGKYGHIAIINWANINQFQALSQNDPLGAKTILKNYSFNYVLGWFRALKTNDNMTDIIKKYGCKTVEELDTKIMEHVGLDWGNENNNDNGSFLASARRTISSLRAELEKKQLEINTTKSELVEKSSALKQVRDELSNFVETLAKKLVTIVDKSEIIGAVDRLLDNESNLQKNVNNLEKAYSLLESEKKEEIKSLRESIEQIKSEYEKALKRVETLEKRLVELESKDGVAESEQAVFKALEKFIQTIKGFFK